MYIPKENQNKTQEFRKNIFLPKNNFSLMFFISWANIPMEKIDRLVKSSIQFSVTFDLN